jgi:hypothetical protein
LERAAQKENGDVASDYDAWLTFSTVCECISDQVFYLSSKTAEIENANIVDNAPRTNNELFSFSVSTISFENVIVRKNNHTSIGTSKDYNGVSFCDNSFATIQNCVPIPHIEHLSSYKCSPPLISVPPTRDNINFMNFIFSSNNVLASFRRYGWKLSICNIVSSF